jgi:hypothetical protein
LLNLLLPDTSATRRRKGESSFVSLLKMCFSPSVNDAISLSEEYKRAAWIGRTDLVIWLPVIDNVRELSRAKVGRVISLLFKVNASLSAKLCALKRGVDHVTLQTVKAQKSQDKQFHGNMTARHIIHLFTVWYIVEIFIMQKVDILHQRRKI